MEALRRYMHAEKQRYTSVEDQSRKMDRQNPRKNGKSKAIQSKSHKEAYTYTLRKREKGKKFISIYIKKYKNQRKGKGREQPNQ